MHSLEYEYYLDIIVAHNWIGSQQKILRKSQGFIYKSF